MGKYSIKELERLSGIKAHTLRIWEKRYNLFEPDRTDTNIRYYSDTDLKKLLNVSILSNSGIKISKIVAMNDVELKQTIAKIEDAAVLKQKRVDDLIVPMIEYDEETFDQLFNDYINEIGVEKTFIDVIYPFLEKIGILWLTDDVEPAQEHFTSHLIRQKLSKVIEDLPVVKEADDSVILFLPEGEYHELGLLFFAYMYKKRGIKVYYFGQSIPISEVQSVSKSIQPSWILTYAVVKPKNGLQKLLNELGKCTAQKVYFIENKFQADLALEYPSIVQPISHFSELFVS